MVLTRAQREANKAGDLQPPPPPPPESNMLRAPAKRGGRKKEVIEEPKPKAKATNTRKRTAVVEPKPEPESVVEKVIKNTKPAAPQSKAAPLERTTRSKPIAKVPERELETPVAETPVAETLEDAQPPAKKKKTTRTRAASKAVKPPTEDDVEAREIEDDTKPALARKTATKAKAASKAAELAAQAEPVEKPKPVPTKKAATRTKGTLKVVEPPAQVEIEANEAEEECKPTKRNATRANPPAKTLTKASAKVPAKPPAKVRITAKKTDKKSNEIEIITLGAAAAKRAERNAPAPSQVAVAPASEELVSSSPKVSKILVEPAPQTRTACAVKPLDQGSLEDPFTTRTSPLKAPAPRVGDISPVKSFSIAVPANNSSGEKVVEATPFKSSSLVSHSETTNLKKSLLSLSPRKAPTTSPLKFPPMSASKFRNDHTEPRDQGHFKNSLLQGSARKPPMFALVKPMTGSAVKPSSFAEEREKLILNVSPRKLRIETPAKAPLALFSSSVLASNPFSTSLIQASPMRPKTPARAPAMIPHTVPAHDVVIEEEELSLLEPPATFKAEIPVEHFTPERLSFAESTTPVEAHVLIPVEVGESTPIDVDDGAMKSAPVDVHTEDRDSQEPPADESTANENIRQGPSTEEPPEEKSRIEEPVEESSTEKHAIEELEIEDPVTEGPEVEECGEPMDVDILEPSEESCTAGIETENYTPRKSSVAVLSSPIDKSRLNDADDETVRFGETIFSWEAESFAADPSVMEPSSEAQEPSTPTIPARGSQLALAVEPWPIQAAIPELPVALASPAKSALRSPEKKVCATSPKKSVSWKQTTPQAKSPVLAPELGVLAGTVFFVDVQSAGADMGYLFAPLLEELGATVVPNWTSNSMALTHVLFKDGSQMTLEKVVATNGDVKCVNIGWALDCEKHNKRIDESDYLINLSHFPIGETPRPLSTLSANSTPLPPRTPARTPSKSAETTTPTYNVGMKLAGATPSNNTMFDFDSEDKENKAPTVLADSPDTPYFLHPSELVQKTCPPKQTHKPMFEMESAQTPFKQRLMAAKRRSAEFAPRIGSPLKRVKGLW